MRLQTASHSRVPLNLAKRKVRPIVRACPAPSARPVPSSLPSIPPLSAANRALQKHAFACSIRHGARLGRLVDLGSGLMRQALPSCFPHRQDPQTPALRKSVRCVLHRPGARRAPLAMSQAARGTNPLSSGMRRRLTRGQILALRTPLDASPGMMARDETVCPPWRMSQPVRSSTPPLTPSTRPRRQTYAQRKVHPAAGCPPVIAGHRNRPANADPDRPRFTPTRPRPGAKQKARRKGGPLPQDCAVQPILRR